MIISPLQFLQKQFLINNICSIFSSLWMCVSAVAQISAGGERCTVGIVLIKEAQVAALTARLLLSH